MKAANDLVDIIKDLIRQELDKRDSVILCEIAAKNADGSAYDVYVVPDHTTLIHNIPNMTRFDLNVGEYCYVYKIQNSFANSFICYVKKL